MRQGALAPKPARAGGPASDAHRKALAIASTARLAQSAERKALNLVVVGSSPTVGAFHRLVA